MSGDDAFIKNGPATGQEKKGIDSAGIRLRAPRPTQAVSVRAFGPEREWPGDPFVVVLPDLGETLTLSTSLFPEAVTGAGFVCRGEPRILVMLLCWFVEEGGRDSGVLPSRVFLS